MSLQKTNLIDIYFQNQILSLERYLSRVVKKKTVGFLFPG